MEKCKSDCGSCQSICASKCPVCGTKGMLVPQETVKSLIKDSKYLKESKTYICLNRKCKNVYFQEDNPKYYLKDEVKRPIWYKENLDEYIVCYCHNICLKDIIEIVKSSSLDNFNKEGIFKMLKITKKDDCLHNFPLGCSCDKLFTNAIEYAYKVKKDE